MPPLFPKAIIMKISPVMLRAFMRICECEARVNRGGPDIGKAFTLIYRDVVRRPWQGKPSEALNAKRLCRVVLSSAGVVPLASV